MIFLTVGTWRTGFDRLVKAVDKLVEMGVIREQVIAQIGNSSYEPEHLKVIRFYSPDEFKDTISKAKMIISHAGIGTILESVKQSKPIIAVPRKESLGEVDNGHQLTTAKQLEAEGLIIVAYEVSELGEKIAQAEHFTVTKNPVQRKSMPGLEALLTKLNSVRIIESPVLFGRQVQKYGRIKS